MNTWTRALSSRRAARTSGRGTRLLLVPALVVAVGATASLADHPSVSLGSSAARGMNTESAIPLGRRTWSLGVRSEYVRFREYSDARLVGLRRRDPDADLHSVDSLLAASLGLLYGVTEDVTLGLRLPYVRRTGIREPGPPLSAAALAAAHATAPHTIDGPPGGVEQLGDVDGIGDLGLFGQWRFARRGPWHAAVLAGLDLPTGETSARASNGERVETEFQPGSGSVDGLLGLAGTFAGGPVMVDASAVYTIAGDGSHDTNLGDVLAYGLALSHRLGGHEHAGDHDHGTGHPFLWDVFVELNGEWREREEVDGRRDGNSGGTLLWLSPGARVTIAGRVAIGVSVGIPIAHDLHGDQVHPSYRLLTSAGLSF